jgi:hypothetical protein
LTEISFSNCEATAIISSGYMGKPDSWCFWDEEYPEDGSIGPFESAQEAEEVARKCGYTEIKRK